MANINKRVPGAYQCFPLHEPAIGTALSDTVFPQNTRIPKLFQPLTIRNLTFKNRIWVSPMCMYSSDNGHATDWHFVHIGTFATRGVGAICMEATAVVPEGRISTEDAGLWMDSQIAPYKRIVDFSHAHDTLIGIQLGHAGRKGSTYTPWVHHETATQHSTPDSVIKESEGGWQPVAPSEIPFSSSYPMPKALTEDDLERIEQAFIDAIARSKAAGFDFIELHYAHGYLMHEFLSPISNHRTDRYGGSLENRMRFPLRVAARARKEWPDKPLFVRISASDWADDLGEKGADGEWKSWGIEQSKVFASELLKIGIDLLDVSSGGLYNEQTVSYSPSYQVPFAEAVKKNTPELLVGTVGSITEAKQAESILQDGKADVVSLARELLRNPSWALHAAQDLGVAVMPANQHALPWRGMIQPARN